MRLRALLAASLLLSSTGCLMSVFVDPMGRRSSFDLAQRRYTQLVRWGEIEKASEFVDPELRGQYLDRLPAFAKVRVTDFETGAVDFAGDAASVTVVYQAYALDAALEAPIRENQDWYREGVTNTWRVRPDLASLDKSFQAQR